MKLATDMHVLEGSHQGSRTYLEGLYGALLSMRKDGELDLEFWVNEFQPSLPLLFVQEVPWREFGPTGRMGRLFLAATRLTRQSRADWIHFQYVLPWRRLCKEAVTIHDVLFETHPEHFPFLERMALRWLVRRSARRADLILTVSEYSRGKICELYGIPGSRVRVTPNGVDTRRFNPDGKASSREKIAEAFGVSGYLLTVGRLDIRKNLVPLIQAYARLRERREGIPPLVLAGSRGNAHPAVLESIRTLGLASNVLHLENVSDEFLPHLYRAARGFILASHAEGFGLPVIEAMACGCPVACSSGTALAELVDPTRGFPFDPAQPEALEAALEHLCDLPPEDPRTARALEFVAAFSWEKAARTFLDGLGR